MEKVKGEHHPFPRAVATRTKQKETKPHSLLPCKPRKFVKNGVGWGRALDTGCAWPGSPLMVPDPDPPCESVVGTSITLTHTSETKNSGTEQSHSLESCRKPHWSSNRIKHEPVLGFPGIPSMTQKSKSHFWMVTWEFKTMCFTETSETTLQSAFSFLDCDFNTSGGNCKVRSAKAPCRWELWLLSTHKSLSVVTILGNTLWLKRDQPTWCSF